MENIKDKWWTISEAHYICSVTVKKCTQSFGRKTWR